MSETKTNFKNELKSAASLILTFSLPILHHYHIHQNAPYDTSESVIPVKLVSQVIQVIPVGQVIPVSPVSPVSPVRLAHLWVDF